jgi:hypothetical protein
VLEFYGSARRETLRAIVIALEGRVAGIIGLAITWEETRIFSEHKPELEPYLSSITVWRAIKAAMRLVDECAQPVYTASSEGRFLKRMGFIEVKPGIWRS